MFLSLRFLSLAACLGPVFFAIAPRLAHAAAPPDPLAPLESELVQIRASLSQAAADAAEMRRDWEALKNHLRSRELGHLLLPPSDVAFATAGWSGETHGPIDAAGVKQIAREAQSHFKARRFEDAAVCYQTILSSHPSNAFAVVNLGIVRFHAGRFDEAERSLRQAIELEPDNALAYTVLGTLCYTQQRIDESISLLSRACVLDPENGDVRNNLSVACTQRGWDRPALEQFLRAIERSFDPTCRCWPAAAPDDPIFAAVERALLARSDTSLAKRSP